MSVDMSEEDKRRSAEALKKAQRPKDDNTADEPPVIRTGNGLING